MRHGKNELVGAKPLARSGATGPSVSIDAGEENAMNLDEQLAEIFGRLGVVMEVSDTEEATLDGENAFDAARPAMPGDSARPDATAPAPDTQAIAEMTLFQTSREHYGVFYRLDLIGGLPSLRIFSPDEENTLRMRCYLVRPSETSPMRAWFTATRTHSGSATYDETRETTEQHLLFAAGESLKRLYWSSEHENQYAPEIEVRRLA
jgi:hypothetical protein